MTVVPVVSLFVAEWSTSIFAEIDGPPWLITSVAESLVERALGSLGADHVIADRIAVHRTATIESGAVLKGPAIIGPRCFVAAGAYLRGGTHLGEDCVVGPGSEVKSSFLSSRTKTAHFNFVGDSILGSDVNLEAGAVIANHRNERGGEIIRILFGGTTIDTGVDKFGALVGDGTRIGANAVVAPGALLPPATVVGRLQSVDQSPR